MSNNLNVAIINEEVFMADDEFIVSKADLRGRLTYVNRTFMEMALLSEVQLLSKNHNIIRHPDMPKGVFNLLWQSIKKEQEFFGFIKNLRNDGRYYWVFANVTAEYDTKGKLMGFLSVRRKPPASAIATIIPLYQQMLQLERSASSAKVSEQSSVEFLQQQCSQFNTDYQHFIIDLFNENNDGAKK
jgi:PAS domain S-box-containing protein